MKYKQPHTGQFVEAKHVPESYYSVYFEDGDINLKEDLCVLKHENAPCLTREDIDEYPNHFRTKALAQRALNQTWKAFKGSEE